MAWWNWLLVTTPRNGDSLLLWWETYVREGTSWRLLGNHPVNHSFRRKGISRIYSQSTLLMKSLWLLQTVLSWKYQQCSQISTWDWQQDCMIDLLTMSRNAEYGENRVLLGIANLIQKLPTTAIKDSTSIGEAELLEHVLWSGIVCSSCWSWKTCTIPMVQHLIIRKW